MARRKLIDKLYKKSRENACKITKTEVSALSSAEDSI
jgi:hypothetical protein